MIAFPPLSDFRKHQTGENKKSLDDKSEMRDHMRGDIRLYLNGAKQRHSSHSHTCTYYYKKL